MPKSLDSNPAPASHPAPAHPPAADGEPFVLVGRHLPVLDGIRGMAILMVIACHLAGQFEGRVSGNDATNLITFLQAGWMGVDLFFVLSGFLITGILFDTRDSPSYFRAFYGRRVLRIFPAYFATLLGLLVVIPALSDRLPSQVADMSAKMVENQAWFWTYTLNWRLAWIGEATRLPGTYFWSLAVEEQFYIVWPFVVMWLTRSALVRTVAVLLPIGLFARLFLLQMGFPPVSVYFSTLTHLDGMFAGALLAAAVRTNGIDPRPGKRFAICAAVSLGLLLAGGVMNGHFHYWDEWVAGTGLSLLAIWFAYLLLATLTSRPDSKLARWFNNPVLRSFGKYSYCIYLLHVPIGVVLQKVFAPARMMIAGSYVPAILLTIAVGCAVSWLIGFISWNLFEKQFLKLKRFFEYEATSGPFTAKPNVEAQQTDLPASIALSPSVAATCVAEKSN